MYTYLGYYPLLKIHLIHHVVHPQGMHLTQAIMSEQANPPADQGVRIYTQLSFCEC